MHMGITKKDKSLQTESTLADLFRLKDALWTLNCVLRARNKVRTICHPLDINSLRHIRNFLRKVRLRNSAKKLVLPSATLYIIDSDWLLAIFILTRTPIG